MVIVAGHLIVEPAERDRYVADCAGVVAAARAADGCLDFAITADVVDPARVVVFERWSSRAAVEAFRGDGPSGDQRAAIVAASVAEYDVADVRSLT